MHKKNILIGLIAFGSLSTAMAQPAGVYIEALGFCAEAIDLEKERRLQSDPRADFSDLTEYCNSLSIQDLEQIRWRCIISQMNDGQSLDAAKGDCSESRE